MKRIELQIKVGCCWRTIRVWINPSTSPLDVDAEVCKLLNHSIGSYTFVIDWRIMVNGEFYSGCLPSTIVHPSEI